MSAKIVGCARVDGGWAIYQDDEQIWAERAEVFLEIELDFGEHGRFRHLQPVEGLLAKDTTDEKLLAGTLGFEDPDEGGSPPEGETPSPTICIGFVTAEDADEALERWAQKSSIFREPPPVLC